MTRKSTLSMNLIRTDQHGPLIVRFYDQHQHLGTDWSCSTRSFEPLIVRIPDLKNP